MPQHVQITEHYWCPGPWPWEWFNTCTRTVWKWCYDFAWVEETGYLFFSYLKGCENGVLYSWYAFSFGILGATYYGPGQMCFDGTLSASGKCAAASVREARITAEVPRAQALARRRIRGPRRHDDASYSGISKPADA